MSKPSIGFIGLGLMGGNMVENLLNKGFSTTVMDLNPDAVAKCTARGAKVAKTGKELAESADIVMLCLTTSNIVEKCTILLTNAQIWLNSSRLLLNSSPILLNISQYC